MLLERKKYYFKISAKFLIYFFLIYFFHSCLSGPAVNLSPSYKTPNYVVPDSWEGSGPFVKANPSEGVLRPDWWKLYNDPILNQLQEELVVANPDLQAAAERFVQARDMMLKMRSRLIPNIGVGFGASNNKQSENALFRGPLDPTTGASITGAGLVSWEPDFWSSIRNATRSQMYQAQERAAEYALAKLSLQAELATDYFVLRGLQAKKATYEKSIDYYKQSLELVIYRYKGGISPELDVYRSKYMLASTQAQLYDIDSQIQVMEHAIAILVNKAPTNFRIEPVGEFKIVEFQIPTQVPTKLLERRPDIAAMERRMAQANQEIGIAKAAFFPNISLGANLGNENNSFNLSKLANSFWSYGSSVSMPVFQGGYRRAQLQQAWSAYRETEDVYRSTVLNAFREVENALTQTKLLYLEAERQDVAVDSALQTQKMTVQLYTGGLSNSLELLFAQLSTLDASISAISVKTELLKSTVALVKSLGGGWDKTQLPSDDKIQPLDIFQMKDFETPKPIEGYPVHSDDNSKFNDLTKPAQPQK